MIFSLHLEGKRFSSKVSLQQNGNLRSGSIFVSLGRKQPSREGETNRDHIKENL